MIDLLRSTFLDRLKRFQLLEAALVEQEQLLLGDVPKLFKQFRKRLTNARKGIEELLPVLSDDPLNRFLIALQAAGQSWDLERAATPAADYFTRVKIEDVAAYLRVCKALADSKKPLNIQELKPFVPGDGLTSKPKLHARHLQILHGAGFITDEGQERRPYVSYQLTDEGRKLIEAILASE